MIATRTLILLGLAALGWPALVMAQESDFDAVASDVESAPAPAPAVDPAFVEEEPVFDAPVTGPSDTARADNKPVDAADPAPASESGSSDSVASDAASAPLATSAVTVDTTPPPPPLEFIAVIADRIGKVGARRGGAKVSARAGAKIAAGDTIRTGKDGKVRLLLKDNSVLSIGPRSKVTIGELHLKKKRSFLIDVIAGRFKMDVAKWFGGETAGTVKTPTAVAGVRGTVLWGDTDLDAICALDGTVWVRPAKADEDDDEKLSDGDCVSGMKRGEVESISPSPSDLAKYLSEVTIE